MEEFNRLVKILLLIIICFCSCKSTRIPVSLLFDYSYDSGWSSSYSVKVYSDGKAYLRKNNLKTDSLYVKDKINLDSLYSLILKVKDTNIAHKYEDSQIQDAPSFNFITFLNDGRISKYYVYGNKHPNLLSKIKDYANRLCRESGWNQLKDTSITFSSMTNFNYVPKIINPGTRVLPPKNLK